MCRVEADWPGWGVVAECSLNCSSGTVVGGSNGGTDVCVCCGSCAVGWSSCIPVWFVAV